MQESPLLGQQPLSTKARALTTQSQLMAHRSFSGCSPLCLWQAPAWVTLHFPYLNMTLAASVGCSEHPCLAGQALQSCSRVAGSRGWPVPSAAMGACCKGQQGDLPCKTPRGGRSMVIREFRSSSLLVRIHNFS